MKRVTTIIGNRNQGKENTLLEVINEMVTDNEDFFLICFTSLNQHGEGILNEKYKSHIHPIMGAVFWFDADPYPKYWTDLYDKYNK